LRTRAYACEAHLPSIFMHAANCSNGDRQTGEFIKQAA
jgi:hypothetical protein